MTMLGYVIRDLLRNPRRTLASLVGVIVGVGLFSAVLFFIDGSGASMTARAVAPLTVDMQRVLSTPPGGGLQFEQQIADPTLAAGRSTLVTLTVTNEGLAAAHEVVIRDPAEGPLAYVLGSTTLDGASVPDVDGKIPLFQGYAGIGLNIGTVPPAATRKISFQVTATEAVAATVDLPVPATISSREALTPYRASAPTPATLASLAERVRRIPGVAAADQLVFADMADGSLSRAGSAVPGPVRLFAFDDTYRSHYTDIQIIDGQISQDRAVISLEAARALRVGVGDEVAITLPGKAEPLRLKVSGVADLSLARPLFESREASNLEAFHYLPFTVVVGPDVYRQQVAPAFERAVATRDTALVSVPLQELDVSVDRSLLDADPATALEQTLAIAKDVQSLASDQDYLVDNISNTLQVAKDDAAIAKRMFIFLGLPGAILAAILTAYAGGLLAEAQRRENALLRVRGANRRHLLSLLAFRTAAIAGVGALAGVALGFAAVVALLGQTVVLEASTAALGQSASIGVIAGMVVTASALYLPGRRLVTQEIKQELAVIERRRVPAWRRFHLDLVVLLMAIVAQIIALRLGAFDVPAGSVYAGESVSLPIYLLGPPIVAWLAGTMLIARIFAAITSRRASSQSLPRFQRLIPGVLWRSITRRLPAMTRGVVTIGLVVGLGTMLVCFSTVYDQAKAADSRFLVGSDIRVTPNPTSGVAHPASIAAHFQVDGVTGTTAVVYSNENSVLTSASNEDVATLAAIDPGAFVEVTAVQDSIFVDGTAAENLAKLQAQPHGVFVNQVLADGLKLEVGDPAQVMFARGTDQQIRKDSKVLGLFTRFPGAPEGTDIVGDIAYYERVAGRNQADYFLVSVADRSPAGLARVEGELAALDGVNRDFVVETSSVALDKDQSSLTALNVVGLLHLDSFFTFLMAATATGMFVFGLLLQRRREYVTLRAQGLQSGGVRRLVLLESGIASILAVAIGVLIGAVMASQFTHVLRPIFTLPPTSEVPAPKLGILVVLVLGATALSAVAASFVIGRLKPTELLRDE